MPVSARLQQPPAYLSPSPKRRPRAARVGAHDTGASAAVIDTEPDQHNYACAFQWASSHVVPKVSMATARIKRFLYGFNHPDLSQSCTIVREAPRWAPIRKRFRTCARPFGQTPCIRTPASVMRAGISSTKRTRLRCCCRTRMRACCVSGMRVVCLECAFQRSCFLFA